MSGKKVMIVLNEQIREGVRCRRCSLYLPDQESLERHLNLSHLEKENKSLKENLSPRKVPKPKNSTKDDSTEDELNPMCNC